MLNSTPLSLILWLISSFIFAVSLIRLSSTKHTSDASAITPDCKSKEKLHHLNESFISKRARLQDSLRRMKDIKKSLNEIDSTRQNVQKKYMKLISHLKYELMRREYECQDLQSQIVQIADKKNKLKLQLFQRGIYVPSLNSRKYSSYSHLPQKLENANGTTEPEV